MKNQRKTRIGITGGIGSGKSTVCKIAASLGIPIYDADSRARWLMQYEDSLRRDLIHSFGQQVYLADGSLNTMYLAAEVFSKEERRQELNSLVHPKVAIDYEDWHSLQIQKAPYTLKEAALLFESGSYKSLDAVIYVYAPIDIRIERIKRRDPHRSEQQIMAIIDKQWNDEQKIPMSQYVLINDGNSSLVEQYILLHKRLLSYSSEG